MTLSVRARIALTLSVALAAFAVIYSISVLRTARERLISELDQKLEIEAFVTADLIRLGVAEAQERLQLRDIIEAEEVNPLGEAIDVEVWRESRLIYRRLPDEPPSLLARVGFAEDVKRVRTEKVQGRRLRIMQVAFEQAGNRWFVRVGADESAHLRGLVTVEQAVVLSAVIALPFAILLSYWVAGRALRPLTRIAEEASAVSVAHFERRVAVPKPQDEIAQLALSFNELLDRLQRAFVELRQFTADASHELRTPLTVMQTLGEVALTTPVTQERQRETISHMLEEVDRLRQLVDALLMLARGETDRSPATASEVVPRALVQSACAHLQPLAEERRQSLSVTGPETRPVLVDAGVVNVAVMNVVHNAIKFTPEGGRIDVHVDCNDTEVAVVVEDSGPGIPEAERDRIFERFYRAEQGRAPGQRGFGLGLAIVRAALGRIGGRITAGESPSGGARISILIPFAYSQVL